ncbi:MAG: sulfite exporter TauE/SafE family protein [Caldilineaceae bacterium]
MTAAAAPVENGFDPGSSKRRRLTVRDVAGIAGGIRLGRAPCAVTATARPSWARTWSAHGGSARHALFLGLTTTITHTAGVFALGLADALRGARFILPETLFPWLSLISTGGCRHRLQDTSAGGAGLPDRHHSHDHAHPHEHAHDHSPGHEHDHEYGHTHSHMPPGADGGLITWRSLLALGISGGLLPCPSALVVMLSATALQRVGLGLVLIIAFSLGLAGKLTGVGMAMVYAASSWHVCSSGGRAVKLRRQSPVRSSSRWRGWASPGRRWAGCAKHGASGARHPPP